MEHTKNLHKIINELSEEYSNLSKEEFDEKFKSRENSIFKDLIDFANRDKENRYIKRIGKAENALMRINSLFSDSERPAQIVHEYFEEVNTWWFDDEENEQFIWKIRHKPTGLFYCSRKGRFTEDKTNLSGKGNFYVTDKHVNKVFSEDLDRVCINKAQVERYTLDKFNPKNNRLYSYARQEDFEIVKYSLEELK